MKLGVSDARKVCRSIRSRSSSWIKAKCFPNNVLPIRLLSCLLSLSMALHLPFSVIWFLLIVSTVPFTVLHLIIFVSLEWGRLVGERSFTFAAPTVSNSLPPDLRSGSSLKSFSSSLKTYLFKLAFSTVTWFIVWCFSTVLSAFDQSSLKM